MIVNKASNGKVSNEKISEAMTVSAKLFKLRSCHRLIFKKIQINIIIDMIAPNTELKARKCLKIEIATEPTTLVKILTAIQKNKSEVDLGDLILRRKGKWLAGSSD